MAAYAAVVSLMNNMEQIMNHPRLSASLHKNQIESLREKLDFLLDFVERDNSNGDEAEVEDLESQIAIAAHAAEDVIESHIVDLIEKGERRSNFLFDLGKKTKAMCKRVGEKVREKIDKYFLHRQHVVLDRSIEESPIMLLDLQEIIEEMDSIKDKVKKLKEERGVIEKHLAYSTPPTSSRHLTIGKDTVVGFDDELIQLMDLLTGQQPDRLIISIVGMGGIGKTTLAKNAYENSVITQTFDIRAWVTISQEYDVNEILFELLSCQGKYVSEKVEELGERLHKTLSGRRYLIILDDLWHFELWDEMKFFFPDNGNRSRVVLTTRLLDVASYCGSSCFRMNFLDEKKSWSLFRQKVFGCEDCPLELEKVGREIVKLCKGLPLSISVIGGLLRKSSRTIGYWQNVCGNIYSVLSSRENDQCFNVLSLSYSHLPVHLKPCFLYMGISQEDREIRVSEISKLWVAEGFLKPNGIQLLEEITESYVKDLMDRNLVLVGSHRKNGKIRSCRIHDLLRDLCIKVAKRENIFCVARANSIPQGIERERRLVCHDFMSKHYNSQLYHAVHSASLARSLICKEFVVPFRYRLLRVLDRYVIVSKLPIFCNFNLRYLTLAACHRMSKLPSSVSLIWNLQTLIIALSFGLVVAPLEIWKMPQLRHIQCNEIYLPDLSLSGKQDGYFILEHLQTLTGVVNLRLSEGVCVRIPNIKKLHMRYDSNLMGHDGALYYSLSNLDRLHKLESLKMDFSSLLNNLYFHMKELTFPTSLNKLSLTNCRLHWEDLTVIGSLPHLEVLILGSYSVEGLEWNPIEGEFRRLIYLSITHCELRFWTTESSHFPILEKLILRELKELKEIPLSIGEIPTLQHICLEHCSESAKISAMKIKEEQESLGNNDIKFKLVG